MRGYLEYIDEQYGRRQLTKYIKSVLVAVENTLRKHTEKCKSVKDEVRRDKKPKAC